MLNDHFLYKFIKNPQAFQMAVHPEAVGSSSAGVPRSSMPESDELARLDRIQAYRQLVQLRELKGNRISQ
ncbi:hypothetical protein RAC89_17890 [Paenibacillus sp. GD4]|uniref:hypothetical protein n=1 Tax=Paenibacillus sp. GD4 TaxID=3068890 RepID=UPI002796783B|nr:hypothetical protein [Paenibacillus sp. GD4]MDQ1912263.1 hypothetical protein [Paenibacillus sp. GD4]